ncbi:tectonin domain-containing protein [Usitatibacter palustris]|uniref:Uncharacterized protein n=1 Tax=Usitatibacter palustris TaxID=2732487 RepID=A0A6M4HA96_9PROT|nr:tectonin domain-containing protein [Usitatibacter palustris]QJR16540.1 hypothetical protein DSM104440_03375 [Usitatibacter palustris]
MKVFARAAAMLAALGLAAASALAHDIKWQSTGGSGLDIGVGGGRAWLVANDGNIYRWDERVTSWVLIPGLSGGARIDVDGAGNALVVTRDNKLFRYNGSGWSGVNGDIRDIGVNSRSEEIWAIGGGGEGDGNYGIYQWHKTAGWQKKPGGAVRIDVDRFGSAWVVNAKGEIFRWESGRWVQVPGRAKDIGIGDDNSVWVIGMDGNPYFWNWKDFVRREGSLTNISVDKWGRPWGVNASGQAFRAQRTGNAIVRADHHNHTSPWSALVFVNQNAGYIFLYDTASMFWEFRPDSTLRIGHDGNRCMTLDNVTPTSAAIPGLFACDGSDRTKGWFYQASDRTLRNKRFPTGCVVAMQHGVSAEFAYRCPAGERGNAPETQADARFVLE